VVNFLQHLQRQGYSEETMCGYSKDLDQFYRYMGDQYGEVDFLLDVVEKRMILGFMDEGRLRGNKVSTVGRRLASLKSFFRFMLYECEYSHDVAGSIQIPKAYAPLKPVPTEREVAELLAVSLRLGDNYRLMFSLLYYTGSRITPVRLLRRDQVNLDTGMIYFPRVKGGRDLHLPLHPTAAVLLKNYFANTAIGKNDYIFPSPKDRKKAISASYVRVQLKRAATLAGLPFPVTPHTLRHCTATHLTIHDVPQAKIASILGHTDLRSTMRYQHLAVDHLRSSLGLLGKEEES